MAYKVQYCRLATLYGWDGQVRPGESYTVQTRKITRRCVVTYEAAGGCTSLRLKCTKFAVPNMDQDQCRQAPPI